MLELTVLAGSCTLELKFLAEKAIDGLTLRQGERLLITSDQQVFRIAPRPLPEPQMAFEQQMEQWRHHVTQLLKKS